MGAGSNCGHPTEPTPAVATQAVAREGTLRATSRPPPFPRSQRFTSAAITRLAEKLRSPPSTGRRCSTTRFLSCFPHPAVHSFRFARRARSGARWLDHEPGDIKAGSTVGRDLAPNVSGTRVLSDGPLIFSPRRLDPSLDDGALSNANARRRECPFELRRRLNGDFGRR